MIKTSSLGCRGPRAEAGLPIMGVPEARSLVPGTARSSSLSTSLLCLSPPARVPARVPLAAGHREAGSTTLTSSEMYHQHYVKRRSEAAQLPARRQAPWLPCSRLSPSALPSCGLCAASSRLAAGWLRASSPHTAL